MKTTDYNKVLISLGVDKKSKVLVNQKNCKGNKTMCINDMIKKSVMLDKKAKESMIKKGYSVRTLKRIYCRFRKMDHIRISHMNNTIFNAIFNKLNAEIIQIALKNIINKEASEEIFCKKEIDILNNKNKFKKRLKRLNKLIELK